jgi:hypothetical protein
MKPQEAVLRVSRTLPQVEDQDAGEGKGKGGHIGQKMVSWISRGMHMLPWYSGKTKESIHTIYQSHYYSSENNVFTYTAHVQQAHSNDFCMQNMRTITLLHCSSTDLLHLHTFFMGFPKVSVSSVQRLRYPFLS